MIQNNIITTEELVSLRDKLEYIFVEEGNKYFKRKRLGLFCSGTSRTIMIISLMYLTVLADWEQNLDGSVTNNITNYISQTDFNNMIQEIYKLVSIYYN